jgi:hypothetical protein
MRILSSLSIMSVLLLTGCQHIHLTPNDTSSLNNTQQNPLRPAIQNLQYDQGHSLHDYAAACIAKSHLIQPTLAGNIIHTPNYALVTLQKSDQAVMGGELCIINKINHRLEITAINDLQFLQKNQDTNSTSP